MAEYLAIPALSGGVLTTLLTECPRAAIEEYRPPEPSDDPAEPDDTEASDRGTIAHSILLEGHADGVVVIDPLDYPADKTGNIPKGWTNKAIQGARDAARAAGKVPVLAAKMNKIITMVRATHAYIESLREAEPDVWAMFQPDGGRSEVTMTWTDGATDCKIRADRISNDNRICCNFKTTASSVEPERWSRTQMLDYYVGGAFYVRGVEAATGMRPTYLFLCQETNPPYLCSLVGLSPHYLDLGMRKVEAGLKLWAECARSGRWPGYPSRAVWPEPPEWEEFRWTEREVMTMEQRMDLGSQP